MRHRTQTRIATMVAVALAAGALATTAAACPLDPDDTCIVSPDRNKVTRTAKPKPKPTAAKPARTLVVSPDTHKTPPRAASAPRSGR